MDRMDILYVLIFLILGYVQSNLANTSPNYEYGVFHHAPGVYFQEIGPAHFYHDRYRIITFIDLRKSLILEASSGLYCEKFKFSCSNLKIHSKVYKQQRRNALNMLGINTEENINSSLLISIFGTFDPQDALFYNEHITPFSTGMKLLDNQTVIFNSSFGTFFPNLTDLPEEDLGIHDFFEFFEQWVDEISTLTTAILFAREGKLYPEILSYTQLIDVLKTAERSLKNRNWTYEPEIYNYEDIINTSDLRVAVISGKLIFDLLIPKFATENDLDSSIIFKIVPFPVKLAAKDLYFYTQPMADYVALKERNSPYLLLSEQQFQECKKTKNFRLCSGWYPSINSKFDNTCEDSLMTGKHDIFLNCPIKLIKSDRTFWYKIKNDAWIFSTSKDLINVMCPENMIDQLVIENYGWIMLNKACCGESNKVILRPHETFKNSFARNLNSLFPKMRILQDVEEYLQKLNVSLDEIVINQFGNYSHLEPESLKLLGTPLAQVKFQAHNLQNIKIVKKLLAEHEKDMEIQNKNVENLKNQNELHGTKIDELIEQMSNLQELRKRQIVMWSCISILTFIVVLCVLHLTNCFQKFEDCLRKKRNFRSFRIRNSGIENCTDEVDYGEGETSLRENSFRTLL